MFLVACPPVSSIPSPSLSPLSSLRQACIIALTRTSQHASCMQLAAYKQTLRAGTWPSCPANVIDSILVADCTHATTPASVRLINSLSRWILARDACRLGHNDAMATVLCMSKVGVPCRTVPCPKYSENPSRQKQEAFAEDELGKPTNIMATIS